MTVLIIYAYFSHFFKRNIDLSLRKKICVSSMDTNSTGWSVCDWMVTEGKDTDGQI